MSGCEELWFAVRKLARPATAQTHLLPQTMGDTSNGRSARTKALAPAQVTWQWCHTSHVTVTNTVKLLRAGCFDSDYAGDSTTSPALFEYIPLKAPVYLFTVCL